MKHRPLLLPLFFLFLTVCELQAQRSVVKTNLLGIISGELGITYELAITSKISATLTGNYVGERQENDFGTFNTKENGFNVIPEVRYYINSGGYAEAPNGLFLGVHGLFEKRTVDIQVSEPPTIMISPDSLSTMGNITRTGFGLSIGYQWILNERFAIELIARPSYQSNSFDGGIERSVYYDPEKDNFKLDRIGISFGIAF